MIDIFTNNLPHIDLHGEDRVNSIIKVDEFITDNIKLRNKKIVIIHGIGEGILKKVVHEYLKKDKRVLDYNLGINNGETIVSLKFDK